MESRIVMLRKIRKMSHAFVCKTKLFTKTNQVVLDLTEIQIILLILNLSINALFCFEMSCRKAW